MKLLDAIFLVGQMPDDSCICCKRPFHQSSDAVIIQLTSDFRVPEETLCEGYEYFLEKSGVEELLELADGKLGSREAKAELVAHYADYDAYPAWFHDICSRGNNKKAQQTNQAAHFVCSDSQIAARFARGLFAALKIEMTTCPACKSNGIADAMKDKALPWMPVVCSSCGARVGMSLLSFATVMVIATFVTVTVFSVLGTVASPLSNILPITTGCVAGAGIIHLGVRNAQLRALSQMQIRVARLALAIVIGCAIANVVYSFWGHRANL